MGLFQAESWGFTGSRRFVQDALQGGLLCDNEVSAEDSPTGLPMCLSPMYPSLQFGKLADVGVAAVMAVDQVGILAGQKLYLHPTQGLPGPNLTALLAAADGLGEGVMASQASVGEMPPTPLTAFLRADGGLPGVIIAGYDDAFVDPLYHSHWDTADRVDTASVAQAATLLARSLLLLAGGDVTAVSAINANETVVAEVFSCLTEDWACDLATPYITGELTNMGDYLREGVSVATPAPPTLYTGVLQSWGNNGLPVLRHTGADGYWTEYARYTGDFDSAKDTLYLVPNALEIFLRTYVSEQLLKMAGPAYQGGACTKSADCTDVCVEVGASAKQECVNGACGCPLAFYHLAMDVGLERTDVPGQFDVLNTSTPLWTEPNWDYIGVKVFLDPGTAIGWLAMSIGSCVAVACIVIVSFAQHALTKRKLL